MKDQNTIDTEELPIDKRIRALDLFIESVLQPDARLRQCAHNQKCYNELMEVRGYVLEELRNLHEYYLKRNEDQSL